MKNKFILILLTFIFLLSTRNVSAIYDPLSVPNNKIGVHIISAVDSELNPAVSMVNNGGDWGYVTVLIEDKDRNESKWQQFFNDLRRKHLIPIVRIATHPDGNNWVRPYENEEQAIADFLDKLNWPTKNRYVVIYNEPNHATEWGGTVDPKNYAQTLSKTIDALKNKNPDFFVLNAGFDAAAPQKMPAYMDEQEFLKQLNLQVPGIFDKLDGWVSHSYPNPGFVGSPQDTGRTSIRGYLWEMQLLKSLGLSKQLPIFITETGWKHAEGKEYDRTLPSSTIVADYYKRAFETAWSYDRLVAVTPFLLTYQEAPFDHFSFKKYTGENQNVKILGAKYPDYYPQYDVLTNLPKTKGQPLQKNMAKLTKGEIFKSFVSNQTYQIPLTFKNIGQSIWNDTETVRLVPSGDFQALNLAPINIPDIKKVEPGGEHTFYVRLKSLNTGNYKVTFNLYEGEKIFESEGYEFATQVKSPVTLKISTSLKWKSNFSGEYVLGIKGPLEEKFTKITLDKSGNSPVIEANYLLPDYPFEFNLEKPFYKPEMLSVKVVSGVNELKFSQLQPDISSALLKPADLWQLLPFSN